MKKNLLKIFPIVSNKFKIHIITGTSEEVIENFDKEMISGLSALITLGEEYHYLSDYLDFDGFVKEENKKELLKKEPYFSKKISLEDKFQKQKEYELQIKGWIGAYKVTKGRKSDNKDFPDNFISLLSNGKVGEFNILPAVGDNRLLEVYIVGQIHVDLFEETELPDMALSNRQGYKTDDLRYIEVIDYVKQKLLPDIIKMRNLYGDYKNKDRNFQKNKEKLEKEKKLINAAKEYKNKASTAIVEGLSDFIKKDSKHAKEIIDKAINNTSPLMGLKKEVDIGKKRILISHANVVGNDKKLSDLICQMLEFNNVPKDYILYTSSDEAEHREPEGMGLFDYLKNFFVNSISTKKIFVIYVTSKKMSESWNAVVEVGAGWITKSDHKVFNIESENYRPEPPLDIHLTWHTSIIKNGAISMDEKNIDLFCQKIIAICKAININPTDKDKNKDELRRLGVNKI